jgi:hypothetical protein
MDLVLRVFIAELSDIIIELIASFLMRMSLVLINLKFLCEIRLHKPTQKGPLRAHLKLHYRPASLDVVNQAFREDYWRLDQDQSPEFGGIVLNYYVSFGIFLDE